MLQNIYFHKYTLVVFCIIYLYLRVMTYLPNVLSILLYISITLIFIILLLKSYVSNIAYEIKISICVRILI